MEGKEFEVIEGISEVLRSGQKEYQALATPPFSLLLLVGWGVMILLMEEEEFEVIKEVLKLGVPSSQLLPHGEGGGAA